MVERGAGSRPAQIEEVPIETLRVGDFVVSYNPSKASFGGGGGRSPGSV